MLAERSQDELEQEGRRMAEEGLGWENIYYKLGVDEETARRFVKQAEFRRMSEIVRSRKDDGGTL